MLDQMAEFFGHLFTWPTLPFSILLIVATAYWVFVTLGFLAFDAIDFDFDFDADVDVDITGHPSLLDIGFLPLKWLNLGSVPLMIWGSVFTLVAWGLSRWLNAGAGHDEFVWASDTQIILRDAALAALATKIITNPIRGVFDYDEPNTLETMIGQTVTVTTSEVSETFGEVEYITDGAPLRLNARTESGVLQKGELAAIIAYDEQSKAYIIRPTSS